MENTASDCRAVLERLYAYLDGEVSSTICIEIEAHLEACRPCFDHAGFERDVKALVRRKCSEAPDPAVVDRLRDRLRSMGAGG